MPPTPTTIPTSFVPKQPVRSGSQFSKSGGNTFLFVAFTLLGIALLSTAGVFGYEQFLKGERDTKAEQVRKAQESISASTVEEFIRTRNRFTSAQLLLDSHVQPSGFFTLLEQMTLETVRFNTLNFVLLEDNSAEIEMSGVARTFNALAAQSAAFSSEKKIKRAIFSDIAVEANKTVTFSLTAELDPELLAVTLADVPQLEQASTTPAVPTATSTPAVPAATTTAPAAAAPAPTTP